MGEENSSNKPDSLSDRLCRLRKEIPDFDERCRNFWLAWKKMMDQRNVARMGYVKMRFYNDKTIAEFLPDERPFTDAEHVLGLVNTIVLFRSFFGNYVSRLYGYQPEWLEYIEQAIFHEIGETVIGDWTDDGSNDRKEKDRLEQKAFDDFVGLFPGTTRDRLQRRFADLRDGKSSTKLLDKEMFVLGIAYLKSKGISGSLAHKDGITEQDKASCEEIKSYRAIDHVFAGILRSYRGYYLAPFIVGINEAIYAIEYNEPDKLVTDCTPGAPPPGVMNLY